MRHIESTHPSPGAVLLKGDLAFYPGGHLPGETGADGMHAIQVAGSGHLGAGAPPLMWRPLTVPN